MNELIEGWAAAKAAGAKRYFGKSCAKDPAHGRARVTSNGKCAECFKVLRRARTLRKRRTPGHSVREKHKARTNARSRRKRSVKGSQHHLAHFLRTRIRGVLAGKSKSARTLELLGCSIDEFRAHLEAQFRDGMAWANAGELWHIDHKRPCASFHLTDPAQQRACFHYSNLQPLLGPENGAKGSLWRGKLWANGKPVSPTPGKQPAARPAPRSRRDDV